MHPHKLIRTFSQLTILSAILGITACTGDDLTGSDGSADASSNDDFTINTGVASHDNFIVLASTLTPAVIDPITGSYKFTEVSITVKLGDKRNQRLTNTHTINFATEWGLITPSCITSDGECTVLWNTSTSEQAPIDDLVTITAYTTGEESFDDTNGNFIFDASDSVFRDLPEPFVDSDHNGFHNGSEPIIDVVSISDPSGTNGVHDLPDTFLSSSGCDIANQALCSVNESTFIWSDLELDLNGS